MSVQPIPDRQPGKPVRRRVFIGRATKKAAYVVPAVLALKAAQKSYAGPSGCGQTGSPCATDGDCCGGWTCQQPNTNPCAGMMNCSCE